MVRIIYWLEIIILSGALTACSTANYAPVRDATPVGTAGSSVLTHSYTEPVATPVLSPASDNTETSYTEPVMVSSLPSEPTVFEENQNVAATTTEETPANVVPVSPAPVQETQKTSPPPAQEKAVVPAPQKTEPKTVTSAAAPVSPNVGKTKWIWPNNGAVSKGFSSQHKGLDIKGKLGDPVYATAEGQVVYSGTGLRGYGQLVIIKHNADFVSAYAHNSAVLVQEGEKVKQGQKIAEIGDTGTDTVKLFFELRYKGKPVDPIKYLPSRQ